ncbi:HNH endonuclease [Glutamicibacter arilaitensis]|uniref:HNH endonuclease n=1 Tax=Glutamicibacter arilaitensis TaxID=256701 RepID=A0A2N7RZI3_9MICC|nr:HNH endonuclease [Glutamicibacter arilaitensis]
MVPNTSPAKKICSIEGCEKPSRSLKMCKMHYTRQLRHGSPEKVQQIHGDDNSRFWSKVDKTNECWNWLGTEHSAGYGKFSIDGKYHYAHRVSYEKLVGEIPPGMEIDHICHNRKCVNPDHLRVTTPKQNNENHQGPKADSVTRVRGVHWYEARSKYMAQVGHNGRNVYVGYFTDIAEAEKAVIAKRNELHTHNDLDRI